MAATALASLVAAHSRAFGVALWGLTAVALSLVAMPLGIAAVLMTRSPTSRRRVLPLVGFTLVTCFAAALALLIMSELLAATRAGHRVAAR